MPVIEYGDSRLPERIWNRIHVVPEMSCWVWSGPLKKRGGYPVSTFDGVVTTALQGLSRIFRPHDPEKFKVRFSCGNVACVNPNHIEVVDKTKCSAGHIGKRYASGSCAECLKEKGKTRTTRASRGTLGKPDKSPRKSKPIRFSDKPKNPALTVFGDLPPDKPWRPAGWSEQVKVR